MTTTTSTPPPTYYEILGVPPTATDRDIRVAYKRLALTCHPDKHKPGNAREEAVLVFIVISEAYEVLSDPEKRAVYDKWGQQGLNNEMTADMAYEMYWEFFQVPYHERGPIPSMTHAAYVASAGLVMAPVKGAVVGTGVVLAGTMAGAGTILGNTMAGTRDFVLGVSQAMGRNQVMEGQPGALRNMSHIVTKPIGGVMKGAVYGVGGAMAGAAIMGSGAVAAGMNVKQGIEEASDRMYGAAMSTWTATQPPPPQPPSHTLLLHDQQQRTEVAQSGHRLFTQAMST